MAETLFLPHLDRSFNPLATSYLSLRFKFVIESSRFGVSKLVKISTPRARSLVEHIVVSVWIVAVSFTRPRCVWMESESGGNVHACHMSELLSETGSIGDLLVFVGAVVNSA